MIGVTPVGIFSVKPDESREFYAKTLGCERVQIIINRNNTEDSLSGKVLRIESTQVELFSTEYKLLDRSINQVVRKDHHLVLRPRNLGTLLNRLQAAGIEPQENPRGGLMFEDLNGVTWEIKYSVREFLSNFQQAA